MKGPLTGLRVLDFSQLGPGPFLTQSLLEMGAEITKVERPPHGDFARTLSPGGHAALNVGKTSLWLDLKDPAQRHQAVALAAAADVVVESSRPGVMSSLGLGYEAIAAINPRAIYVSITGYGQTGPHVREPGHDINYMAASGFVAIAGGLHGEPSDASGVPIGDFCAGQAALSATLAALIEVGRSGKGQHLDVSIVDSLIHWMNARLGHWQHGKTQTLAEQRRDVFGKPAYGVFRAGDGAYLAIAALEEHFFLRLKEALHLKLEDVPHETRDERFANARAINAAINAALAELTLADAIDRLRSADVAATPVIEPWDLPVSAQALARDLYRRNGDIAYTRFPVLVRGGL